MTTLPELVKRGNEAMFSRDAGTYLLAEVIHEAHLLNHEQRPATLEWASENFGIQSSALSKYLAFGALPAGDDLRVMRLPLSEGYYVAKAVREGVVTVKGACDYFFATETRRSLADFRADFLGVEKADEKPYCECVPKCEKCAKELLHHPSGS